MFFKCLLLLIISENSISSKPNSTEVDKNITIKWLLGKEIKCNKFEIQSYDGWHNNLAKIDAGSTGQRVFFDPSEQTQWTEREQNYSEYGLLYICLAKQISQEIMDVRRSNDEGQYVNNYATPFIDGGILYSPCRYRSYHLRKNNSGFVNDKGSLESLAGKAKCKNGKCSSAGLVYIWYLLHNKLAYEIFTLNGSCTSDEIFNLARKYVIAIQQNVYFYEWLPYWIESSVPKYIKYDPMIDPQIDQSFYSHFLINDPLQHLEKNNETDHADCLLQPILANKTTACLQKITYVCDKDLLINQFKRIRDGDRFWFENRENKLHFSDPDIEKIRKIKLQDIISILENDTHDISQRITLCTTPIRQNKVKLNESFNSIVLSMLLLVCIVTCTAAIGHNFINKKNNNVNNRPDSLIRKTLPEDFGKNNPIFIVKEYVGEKQGLRDILVVFKIEEKQIVINSFHGTVFRVIDCNTHLKTVVKFYILYGEPTLILKFSHYYDLVLKFQSNFLRQEFIKTFDRFLSENQQLEKELIKNFNWKAAKPIIVTKEHRRSWLEMFFRVAFAQAFKINHSREEILTVDASLARKIIYIELTKFEFADALNMQPQNPFVTKMFTLVDKDRNGFISFREFLDLIVIFAEGNVEKKAKLLFDMYDINGIGHLEVDDFSAMIKSFVENIIHIDKNIEKKVAVMLESVNVDNKQFLDFEQFKNIIGQNILGHAKLGFKVDKFVENESDRSPTTPYQQRSFKFTLEEEESFFEPPIKPTRLNKLLKLIQLYSKQLFWTVLLTLLILYISFGNLIDINKSARENEKKQHNFWYESVIELQTNTSGNVLLFIYSVLLITMCRNIWTALSSSPLKRWLPINYLTHIHSYIGYLSIIFTVVHVATEMMRLFECSKLPLDKRFSKNYLIMREFQSYWSDCLDPTLVTGFLLTIICSAIYASSIPYLRTRFFNSFYNIHRLYLLIILLLIIHGSQRQIKSPMIFTIMSVPLLLYFVDLFVTINRKKIEVPVLRAEFLPSDVTCLIIRRPENFQYKVGQWIRLAVPNISRREFSQFPLSSAPSEPDLRIYIPMTNSWTRRVQSLLDGPGKGNRAAPIRVRLEGPFGGGLQDWQRYDVAILVGGGSGVAPFAAVLKDIAHCLKVKATVHCQKVYFLWVSKTQKQFEWFTDLIQETENNDKNGYLSCHIFITEFYERFDLRTILLFICEKHYQRISGKSLFTNLRSATFFGRPQFTNIFRTVKTMHKTCLNFGVFSSGPNYLIEAVGTACNDINAESNRRFEHNANIL